MTLRSTPRTVLAGLDGAARVREGRRAHTVRTGRGRFRASLRARRGLQVMARVPRQRAGYSSDYSCPLGFEVRGR